MSDRQQEMETQRRHQHHSSNLARPPNDDDQQPQTLKYVSEPEDVDTPLDQLEWINSKSASTANFEEEDVRSKEWVLEYHQLIAKMARPPEYGLTGHLRAWAFDNQDAFEKPLAPDEELDVEGFSEIGKEASTRSKEGWGVETSTRDTKESIVRDGSGNNSGGLLGKLRGG